MPPRACVRRHYRLGRHPRREPVRALRTDDQHIPRAFRADLHTREQPHRWEEALQLGELASPPHNVMLGEYQRIQTITLSRSNHLFWFAAAARRMAPCVHMYVDPQDLALSWLFR